MSNTELTIEIIMVVIVWLIIWIRWILEKNKYK